MLLRPRQKTFVERSVAALASRGNTLGVAPTGAGKTIMLSAVTGEMIGDGAKACVLAHRDELTAQNRAKFQRVVPGVATSVIDATEKSWGGDVTFAMVPTLARVSNLADMPRLDLLVIDEAHHAVADSYRRIIDLEKEATVLLINALETIGDTYGIYGFSGYGRENVEFYVIKDINEEFSDKVKRRIDKVTPLHATRMGAAIRHAITKLENQDAKTKIMFLISDGRPQDRGYSREGVEKEYAVHDTHMALVEARRKDIIPFCLTVDKAGHDYLKSMCGDMGYEVLADIWSLPERLPMLYRQLTAIR